MPSILSLPSRFSQQPRQAPALDRGNRLAAGLVGAWIPQNGAAKAVNGATVTPISAGLGFATTTTAYWQASANAVISLSPTWTILAMVSGAQAGVGNGFPLYCERPNATQLLKLQIGLGATSTANLVVRDANGVGLVNISGTTDVRTPTGIRTLVGTRRSLSDHRLFVNGAQEGTSAVNPGSTFANTSATLGYDMQDAGAALTTAVLPIVLVWNRALSDAEIAEISRNPWQVFKAPSRRLLLETVSAAAALTPGTSAVSFTGLPPALSQSDNRNLAPGTGSLSFNGLGPSLVQSSNKNFSPAPAAVIFTGLPPTLNQSPIQSLSPGTGAVTFTGLAPTLSQSANRILPPGPGAVTFAGLQPSLVQSVQRTLTPGSGAVVFTGLVPSLSQSGATILKPAPASITFTGLQPSLAIRVPPGPPPPLSAGSGAGSGLQALPPVPPLTQEGFAANTWQRWFDILRNNVNKGYSAVNGPPDEFSPTASLALVAGLRQDLQTLELAIAMLPNPVAAAQALQRISALLGEDANFANLTASGKFGVNGKPAQAAAAVPAAATDAATTMALVNALRLLLIANGQAV